MKLIADFVSKKLALLILIVAIATYFSPFTWNAPLWVPSIFLGIVMFFTGLSMNISSIKNLHHKKKELLIIVLLKWSVTVLIAIMLAKFFFSDYPDVAAGIILQGSVPSAAAASLYTLLSGGNTALVVAASLLDIVISPFIAPLALAGLGDSVVSISLINLFKSFMIMVIIPLSFGLTLQRKFPQLPHQATQISKLSSPLSLIIVIHLLMNNGKQFISAELMILPTLIFVLILQTILSMLINYTVASYLFEQKSDAIAALYQTSICNAGLAGILAHEFFGGLGAIAPILAFIIGLSIGAQITNYFVNKQLPLSLQKAEL